MKYSVIALEREYASGGRAIGERTAQILGIPCYDSQVLQMAAQKLGKSPENVRSMEETAPNTLRQTLSAMADAWSFDGSRVDSDNNLQVAEAKVIWELAQKPCVIIGRCAGAILKERRDVLRVFVHASPKFRRDRALMEYQIPQKELDRTLRQFDRRRSEYYTYCSSQKWDDRACYHLMMDSSQLGLESCAQALAAIARG